MAQSKTSKKTASPQTVIKFKDETKVHPALSTYFGYCLFKASARLRQIMDQALMPMKLQTHHVGILKVLEISGPMSQIELGDALGFDKASMVKMIDHLEKNKYVVRKTEVSDRRVKIIQVTAKGVSVTRICHQLKDKVEKEFFKNIQPSEMQQLKKLVPRLLT